MTCNRVAIISRGEVVATDAPDNLMSRLAGELSYEIEIKGDGATARQALAALAAVRQVDILASEILPEGHQRLQVRVDSAQDPGSAIASTLIAAGLELFELRRHRASLEEVFLNLTTEEAPHFPTDTDNPAQSFDPEASDLAEEAPADKESSSGAAPSDV